MQKMPIHRFSFESSRYKCSLVEVHVGLVAGVAVLFVPESGFHRRFLER